MTNQNLVYLAGPITGLTYGDAVDWRDYVRDHSAPWINTISPMRCKQRLKEIPSGSQILDSYEDNPLTTAKGINTRDFNDVKNCSCVFVNFLGATKVSIGTVMEIAWARAFAKTVICVMEEGNTHRHSMLDYACGYILDDLDQAIALLNILLCTDKEAKQLV